MDFERASTPATIALLQLTQCAFASQSAPNMLTNRGWTPSACTASAFDLQGHPCSTVREFQSVATKRENRLKQCQAS
eukprot:6121526-Amphidinium_carterae.2